MHKKLLMSVVGLALIILLNACQSGGAGNIVGRWESQEMDAVYEFYEDGSGVSFINPYSASDFTYVYKPGGTLEITVSAGELKQTRKYNIVFISNEEISIEDITMEDRPKSFGNFSRAPLSELPAHARAKLALVLKDENYEITGVELIPDPENYDYGATIMRFRTEVTFTLGETAEEWLVTVKFGNTQEPARFVLVKQDETWGVIELITE